jgi:hypothetical protein
MVPAHNNHQQEKKDNRFDLRSDEERKRGREEERKRGREEERKRGREEERKRGREEESKTTRQQDNKTTRQQGNDWICKGRKKMVSKHGVWSQYAATNNKRQKTTVLI